MEKFSVSARGYRSHTSVTLQAYYAQEALPYGYKAAIIYQVRECCEWCVTITMNVTE